MVPESHTKKILIQLLWHETSMDIFEIVQLILSNWVEIHHLTPCPIFRMLMAKGILYLTVFSRFHARNLHEYTFIHQFATSYLLTTKQKE